MASRHLVLEELGDPLAAAVRPSDRLTRVGIDGVDGAGKTRLAEELAQALTARAASGRSHHARLTRRDARALPHPLPAGQRRYIDEQRPHERATFVVRNTDLTEPELVTNRS